jgi:NAD(P)-dependent dehydrogenase (short-subunit alcohol dehydrogenase family)
MELTGKGTVITGAARGIGKAAALEFARRGSAVVVAARTDTPRDSKPGTIGETAAEIEALGGTALALRCDVADEEQIQSLVRATLDRFGRCDVLINNAAVTNRLVFTPMAQLSREEFERCLAVNVTAPFMLSKHFSEQMKQQGSGLIMNVTSGSANFVDLSVPKGALETGITYGTTKAALNRLGNAVARELQPHGIPCITVDPGFTDTQGESVRAGMASRGHDLAQRGHPVEWPARTLAYLATCDDPMEYSGTIVVTATFVREKGLA